MSEGKPQRLPKSETIDLSDYFPGSGMLWADGDNVSLHFAKPIPGRKGYADAVTLVLNPITARHAELAIRYALDIIREQLPEMNEKLTEFESKLTGNLSRYFRKE